MKTRPILLGVLLAALLALAGCGGHSDGISGDWSATVDLTDYYNEQLTQNEEYGPYIKVSDFSFQYQVTFQPDGAYTMRVDRASAEKALDAIKADISNGMRAYLQAMIDQAGLDMTVDDLMAVSGLSMDETLAEMDDLYNVDDMVRRLNHEGQYKAADGRLYRSDDPDQAADETRWEAYDLNGDSLVLREGGGSEDKDLALLLPLSFERQ